MQALLRKSTALFGSSSSLTSKSSTRDHLASGTGFQTVLSHEALFPKVDPRVDGEECLHDCATCTIRYPSKFDIEQSDELYGHVKGWSTHLLVATGKTDWVRDVADEPGSVMEAIEKGNLKPSNGKLKLSASNIPVPDEYHQYSVGQQPTTVLILPSFTFVDHVTPQLAPDLIKLFVNPAPTTTSPLDGGIRTPPRSEDLPSQSQPDERFPSQKYVDTPTALRSRPCPHAAVILLCSQRTRDARCGQSAPLLKREFERHLRAAGLYRDMDDERPGGVGIYFISHVGGHKYAANVMVYRRRDFEWYRKTNTVNHHSAIQVVSGEAERSHTTESRQGNSSALAAAAAEEEQGAMDEGASQCIWLARVRPEDCENIVRFTVLKGKVVKPASQLRGGFDRERGLVSW